jgi:hypothetical protein
MKKKPPRIIKSVALDVAQAPFRFVVPVCRPCTSQYNSRGHDPFLLSSASGDGRVMSIVIM